MKTICIQTMKGLMLVSLASAASAAVTLPKEGSFDTNFCFSATGDAIPLTDKVFAGSYTLFATVLSNTPGGAFDRTVSHCLGIYHMVNGREVDNGYCDIVDSDGDKYLVRYSGDDKSGKVESIAGTGKYEGMTLQGQYQIGALPTTAPDRVYRCNRYSGTYKLK